MTSSPNPEDCDACDNWKPDSGLYSNGCLSCQARMLAASHHAWIAYARGRPGQLRGTMRLVWKDTEQYEAGRLLVHRWWLRTRPGAA